MTKYRKTDPEISRRKFINVAMGATAGIGGLSFISILGSARPLSKDTPDRLPPAEGDVLVYAEGANAGKPIDPDTLEENPTRAYPLGTVGGEDVLKSGDPNNLVLIMKFPESALQAPTNLDVAPGGIVAYSAVCTHLGCQVNYKADDKTLLCPCHSGLYDPKAGCKVIGGPPPRALPQLPIKVEDGRLVAAGTYLAAPYGVTEHDYEDYKAKAEEASNT